MKTLGYLLFVALLSGCASSVKLKDLNEHKDGSYFLLSEDYTRFQVRGLSNWKWIEGLRAGKYTAVAEDAEGIYYQGAGDSVIVLANENAERYLADKTIAPMAERNSQNIWKGGDGGLWMPKHPDKSRPKIYYFLTGTAEAINDKNRMFQVGIIPSIIILNAEGDILWVPEINDQAFTDKIKIEHE